VTDAGTTTLVTTWVPASSVASSTRYSLAPPTARQEAPTVTPVRTAPTNAAGPPSHSGVVGSGRGGSGALPGCTVVPMPGATATSAPRALPLPRPRTRAALPSWFAIALAPLSSTLITAEPCASSASDDGVTTRSPREPVSSTSRERSAPRSRWASVLACRPACCAGPKTMTTVFSRMRTCDSSRKVSAAEARARALTRHARYSSMPSCAGSHASALGSRTRT
jgi:hypothetical protein